MKIGKLTLCYQFKWAIFSLDMKAHFDKGRINHSDGLPFEVKTFLSLVVEQECIMIINK